MIEAGYVASYMNVVFGTGIAAVVCFSVAAMCFIPTTDEKTKEKVPTSKYEKRAGLAIAVIGAIFTVALIGLLLYLASVMAAVWPR